MLQHAATSQQWTCFTQAPELDSTFQEDLDFVMSQLDVPDFALPFGNPSDFSYSRDSELNTWLGCVSPLPVMEAVREHRVPLVTGTKRRASEIEESSSSLQDSINELKALSAKQPKWDGGTISPPSGMRVKRVKVDELFAGYAIQTPIPADCNVEVAQPEDEEVLPAQDEIPCFRSTNHSGESRLRINFLSIGKVGAVAQHFGKSGHVIPHGLVGTHEMYDQSWRFEVEHEHQANSKQVLIVWKITNLTSATTVSLKETPQQANRREFSGRTVCNKIVKQALNTRAAELQASLATVSGAKRSSMECAIRALQPRLCTVGLLFFGLLHEGIQAQLQGLAI